MRVRRIDYFELGDKVVFRKYLESFNKVGIVVGIDKLDQNIAVKTRFKTYIVRLIDEIVKIEENRKCLKKSKKK